MCILRGERPGFRRIFQELTNLSMHLGATVGLVVQPATTQAQQDRQQAGTSVTMIEEFSAVFVIGSLFGRPFVRRPITELLPNGFKLPVNQFFAFRQKVSALVWPGQKILLTCQSFLFVLVAQLFGCNILPPRYPVWESNFFPH